ncbi:MAG: transcriptional regulator [Rhodobacteraceae bacterium]|nr:transcriptional regulator [Paracoccaceae bacterium]
MPARRAQNYACPVRDVLDRVGDAWSVLVIVELARGPCRFNALKRVIDGISQRMLAVTLRHLERDGLVTRRVLPLAPPQVEYALTDRGLSLHLAIGTLNSWAEQNQTGIRESRAAYDAARAEPA